MRDDELIGRLREVRQLRQRRAEETVVRKKAELEEATARKGAAAAAVAAQLHRAAEAEQAALEALMSKPAASLADMYTIQGRPGRARREVELLREAEREAAANEAARLSELSTAQRELNHCHKATIKLGHLVDKADARKVRRAAVLAEATEEETHRLGPRWPEL
ncbi:hypothetical protein [Nitratireductor pacificus]|uniref:Uncharacterized protein n=1 Tax=Nitratireductor pacificus pht-3B TaxID=391937 RepID=K2N0G2_9HYPH|nr:hypothetical protein [Nitratireductor pacificus]EKF17688.1 hypothetical protein NA2_16552 [Nitratireductor pacificus pht-3B]